MSAPLEDQLRDYFSMVDRMQSGIDLDAIEHRTTAPTLRLINTDNPDQPDPDQPDIDHLEEAMLAPNKNETPTRSRTWMMVAAAITALVLVAGLIVASRDNNEEPVPANQPATTVPVTAPVVEVAPAAQELTTREEVPVPAGTYVTDRLGMATTFTTESDLRMFFEQTGQFLLADLDNSTGEIKGMRLTRLGGWHTGEEAAVPVAGNAASIDPNDIEAWIADNDVIAERLPDATVDGHPAKVYDVRIDPSSELQVGCTSLEAPCFYINRVSDESYDPTKIDDFDRTIFKGLSSRMWLVEVPGLDPILIEAVAGIHPSFDPDAGPSDGGEPWLDEFETAILPTFEFGPDGPALTRS